MVSVVQLVEHRIVVPSVVGSSPITHPSKGPGLVTGAFLCILAERGICRRELAKKGLCEGLAEGAVPRSGIADLV